MNATVERWVRLGSLGYGELSGTVFMAIGGGFGKSVFGRSDLGVFRWLLWQPQASWEAGNLSGWVTAAEYYGGGVYRKIIFFGASSWGKS